jgi:hypothetical protein
MNKNVDKLMFVLISSGTLATGVYFVTVDKALEAIFMAIVSVVAAIFAHMETGYILEVKVLVKEEDEDDDDNETEFDWSQIPTGPNTAQNKKDKPVRKL